MTRILERTIATGLALAVVLLASAHADAAQDDTRTARPSTLDYVDGTVGMD